MDDSTISLIEALRAQLELLSEKNSRLQKKVWFHENKIKELTLLLDDHIEGFSADYSLRLSRGENVAATDCQLAADILDKIKRVIISNEEYSYLEDLESQNE